MLIELSAYSDVRFIVGYHSDIIQSLQNLIAISQRSWQPLLTLKAGCIGNNGKIGYSIQGLVAKVKDTVAIG